MMNVIRNRTSNPLFIALAAAVACTACSSDKKDDDKKSGKTVTTAEKGTTNDKSEPTKRSGGLSDEDKVRVVRLFKEWKTAKGEGTKATAAQAALLKHGKYTIAAFHVLVVSECKKHKSVPLSKQLDHMLYMQRMLKVLEALGPKGKAKIKSTFTTDGADLINLRMCTK